MKNVYLNGCDLEAVLFNESGHPIDWWDPVHSVEETDTHWIIDGYHEYKVPKRHGYRLVVREMEASQ